MTNVRHVLGISGGKDSAALAIYLKNSFPSLDIEYYTCDTGKELDETYRMVKNLEIYLGKKINNLVGAAESHLPPFDHFLEIYGGYLPSSNSRWCTKKLKLEPFEKYVSNDPVISYVGIRGDEDREGYISTKPNIQSIFPFRKNIWSEDVTKLILTNSNITEVADLCRSIAPSSSRDKMLKVILEPLSSKYPMRKKLDSLLEANTIVFNHVVFQFLKNTSYPMSRVDSFPLLDKEDILVKDDIYRLLEESGVGIPQYYKPIDFEVEGYSGQYARSRSGCFFCFFQQKIEWVWLYEQHLELFQKAIEYEKNGYTWIQGESLEELTKPERISQIKRDYLNKVKTSKINNSNKLLDILLDNEEGCAACFI